MSRALLWIAVLISVSGTVNADIITQRNFNSSIPNANTGTGVVVPNIGSGTASLVGATTATVASGDANGGSTDPATGDDSGWNITSFAAQGGNARGVELRSARQARWASQYRGTSDTVTQPHEGLNFFIAPTVRRSLRSGRLLTPQLVTLGLTIVVSISHRLRLLKTIPTSLFAFCSGRLPVVITKLQLLLVHMPPPELGDSIW